MPAAAYTHEVDPREKLLDAVGDVSGVEIFHTQVLVAIYIAPEKTKGGIIRPDMNVEEDKYQGKVGLILKCADSAFQSDSKWHWPEDIGVGDWVFFKISDTVALSVNRQPCRIIEDVDVRGRTKHPDIVW